MRVKIINFLLINGKYNDKMPSYILFAPALLIILLMFHIHSHTLFGMKIEFYQLSMLQAAVELKPLFSLPL